MYTWIASILNHIDYNKRSYFIFIKSDEIIIICVEAHSLSYQARQASVDVKSMERNDPGVVLEGGGGLISSLGFE